MSDLAVLFRLNLYRRTITGVCVIVVLAVLAFRLWPRRNSLEPQPLRISPFVIS